MAEYLIKQAETKSLEYWINELITETNRNLHKAKIYGLYVATELSPELGIPSGHIGALVNYYNDEKETILREVEEDVFHDAILDIAKTVFGIPFTTLDDFRIEFVEKSERDLYALTQGKETAVRRVLGNFPRYIKFYNSYFQKYIGFVKSNRAREREFFSQASREAVKNYFLNLDISSIREI